MTESSGMGAASEVLSQSPLRSLPAELSAFVSAPWSTPIECAEVLGEAYLSFARHKHRKSVGHYLTPAAVARFMAECSCFPAPHLRVLDPGSGTGILSAAVCEAVAADRNVKSLHVVAYETELLLADLTRRVLTLSRDWLSQRGISLTFDVRNEDFVMESAASIKSMTEANWFGGSEEPRSEYDLVISNPPYFKIGKDDPRAVAWSSVVNGQPNIYALFMSISAELLSKSGQLVYHRAEELCVGALLQEISRSLFPKSGSNGHSSVRIQKGRFQEPDGAPGELDHRRPEAGGRRGYGWASGSRVPQQGCSRPG